MTGKPYENTVWGDPLANESWAGEIRVNLIRLTGIMVFYGYHLVNVYLIQDDPGLRSGSFHAAVTVTSMAWAAMVLVVHHCLSRRFMPPALKYVTVLGDLLFATGMMMLMGDPRSPLVAVYFLIILSAPLRLALELVYVAAVGSVLGYWFLLGHYAFYLVGAEKYYSTPELRVSRTTEVITTLALLVAGLLAGQIVRQARRLALEGKP